MQFPVIRVYRQNLDQEIMVHCAMLDCATPEAALAAYRPQPGDKKVEFAWWGVSATPEPALILAP